MNTNFRGSSPENVAGSPYSTGRRPHYPLLANEAHIVNTTGVNDHSSDDLNICSNLNPGPADLSLAQPFASCHTEANSNYTTVHDFLEHLAARPAKTYGRRKRIAIIGSQHCQEKDRASSTPGLGQQSPPTLDMESEPLPHRNMNQIARRKRHAKPTAQRLLEAAVYAHVDLPESSTYNTSKILCTGSRRPLSFHPARLFSPSPATLACQQPLNCNKTADALRSVTFGETETLSHQDSDHMPMTGRKLTTPVTAGPQEGEQKRVTSRVHRRIPSALMRRNFPSLRFVPIENHDKALQLRREASKFAYIFNPKC